MMKQAIFLVVDYGIDGRDKESIKFASLDEVERNNWYENSPKKPWYRCVDRVGDLQVIALEAWKKLDGLEKLALLDTNAPMWQKDFKDTP
jgi:hypothetical protein